MRISDWSSDVCSADLRLRLGRDHDDGLDEVPPGPGLQGGEARRLLRLRFRRHAHRRQDRLLGPGRYRRVPAPDVVIAGLDADEVGETVEQGRRAAPVTRRTRRKIGSAAERERGSDRVDLGGGRKIKKKKK